MAQAMLRPLTRLTAIAAPLPLANVDTDQLLPARFMRRPRGDGYHPYLLHDLAHDAEGRPDPDFVLNRPDYAGAGILVARRNFGGGSSREGAVYALVDAGFRVIIAPGFGDIFRANALKNGMLPVALDEAVVDRLLTALAASPGATVSVDLPEQTVTLPMGAGRAEVFGFEVDPFRKDLLVRGLDEIGLTLSLADEIAGYAEVRTRHEPWVVPDSRIT
ncbi:3-isopropylmalate dehydratase small subunit [Tistrella mobilis]|uniref:3-isopropylmalate dehydratase small subunit n=1 Tax=Tistrella mobilis (strain KA081020-065) TaxID=1110502 RepID=I3TUW6_TISMK|nr:3-isopropylmalate dehydratase small subunit [Tistrella mobilis]AFK56554.1 3-isopropylmalate dehydratase, small subunit [Tistrella mobilis KA081020-065]